jgi:hypothetical protein
MADFLQTALRVSNIYMGRVNLLMFGSDIEPLFLRMDINKYLNAFI